MAACGRGRVRDGLPALASDAFGALLRFELGECLGDGGRVHVTCDWGAVTLGEFLSVRGFGRERRPAAGR
jgi:hypothetical protein